MSNKCYDDPNCGVSQALKILGAKWTILILRDLFEGTRRFGQLQRSLAGISPKTLSLRLAELEAEGIIKKKIYAQVPLKVEYSLTEKGRSFEKVLDSMRTWGENYNETISKSL